MLITWEFTHGTSWWADVCDVGGGVVVVSRPPQYGAETDPGRGDREAAGEN